MLQIPTSRTRVFGRRPVLDVVLELVDLVVQRVDQVEVPLGDLVDEVVERSSRRTLVGSAGRLAGRDVERLAAVPVSCAP